jgi:hypothetical protein
MEARRTLHARRGHRVRAPLAACTAWLEDGVISYRVTPYAQLPIEQRRWRPPLPMEPRQP